MEKLLILLMILGCVWAHKPCCYPKQLEGSLSTFQGGVAMPKSKYEQTVVMMSFSADYNKMMLFNNETIWNGAKPVQLTALYDGIKGIVYMINHSEPDKCYVLPAKGAVMPCLPPYAVYAGRNYMGVNKAKLNYETYQLPIKDKSVKADLYVSVTKDCVPIGLLGFMQTYDKKGGLSSSSLLSSGYYGMKPKISDKHVFDIPPQCKHATMEKDPSKILDQFPNSALMTHLRINVDVNRS